MPGVPGIVQVFAVVVLVLTPTLLFLAFWRALMYLRDDDLVDELLAEAGTESPPEGPIAVRQLAFDTEAVGADASDIRGPAVRCGGCATVNVAHATYCRHCLSEL